MTASNKNDLLLVSPQFKAEATKALFAIIAFIIVYLLLIVLSIGLVALCFSGGIAIISMRPGFYTLIAGLGLMATGVMVFVFLIKFIFSSSGANDKDSIEVTAREHPMLFAMIDELAEQTGTTKPKKVFLSREVNACVFYHSSFWSMFLPIKKNLKIGLGLVNSVNASELKAVIAHEFGHFSQRSMKLGSWVYNVNKIIHNMLYNNSSYGKTLDTISGLNDILSFFGMLTVKVVQGIQWVLKQMFGVVNKAYLSLSRQMEFHADLVAATTCGSNNIINALRRSEFADTCYHTTLHICNIAWNDKKVVHDFYSCHAIAMKRIADLNEMPVIDGLAVVSERNSKITNRVNFRDQWASHPTLQERSTYLQPFDLEAQVEKQSAWIYFSNDKKWKEQLTHFFYEGINLEEIKGTVDNALFEELLNKEVKHFSMPPLFKEYYDSRQVKPFDADAISKEPFTILQFESLFTDEVALLPKKLQMLEHDIATLTAIVKGEIETRSFDFDGRKCNIDEAKQVLAQLEQEKETLSDALIQTDQMLFRYFYATAPLAEAEALKRAYVLHFSQCNDAEEYLTAADKMMDSLAPLFRGETLQVETINEMISNLKAIYEPGYKEVLKKWKERKVFDTDAGLAEKINKFLTNDYAYFYESSFMENELSDLNEVVQQAWSCISDHLFVQFKSITEKQAAIAEKKEHKSDVISTVYN